MKTYTACLVATSALLLAFCGATSALADDACGNPRTPTEKPECASGEESDDGCPSNNECDPGSPNDGAGVNTFNVFTGNLHRTITDIEVWGGVGEIPLRLKRTTTSRYMGGVPTPFAGSCNWRHNWQWYIVYGGLNQAGQEIINVYYPDGRNRDVKRTIDGTTTYLIYDGWNLVAEYDAAGVLTTRYIHGPQVDEILAKVTTTSTTFPLPDALGSTIAVTDASGAVLERVYYSDAFGTPTFQDAAGSPLAGTSTGTRFLFTGREWLAALNLYDYRNRTYSAELGRFIETDPIGFKAGDANLFRYVVNNPVAFTDPDGKVKFGPSLTQDRVCSTGALSPGMNRNRCVLACCREHDQCYSHYRCNSSSWIFFDANCFRCNARVVACIALCPCPVSL
ncbi:MAG: hypothetical protein RIQ71_870 [Verrucomicrobiota bacterium]